MRGGQLELRRCPALELGLRLGVIGDGRVALGAGTDRLLDLGARGRDEGHAAAVTDDAVLFFDLQIGESTHRVRRLVIVGGFAEEVPIAGQRLVEAVVDGHLGDVGLDVAQLLDGPAIGMARAAREKPDEQQTGRKHGHYGASSYWA